MKALTNICFIDFTLRYVKFPSVSALYRKAALPKILR